MTVSRACRLLYRRNADCETEKYLQMLEKHRVRGFLFEQQNYTSPQQWAAAQGAVDPTVAAKNAPKKD